MWPTGTWKHFKLTQVKLLNWNTDLGLTKKGRIRNALNIRIRIWKSRFGSTALVRKSKFRPQKSIQSNVKSCSEHFLTYFLKKRLTQYYHLLTLQVRILFLPCSLRGGTKTIHILSLCITRGYTGFSIMWFCGIQGLHRKIYLVYMEKQQKSGANFGRRIIEQRS